MADSLLDVFSMDLDYFITAVPVVEEIWEVVLAVGWALLLGNLVFQAAKSMLSGLGFEGEDPRILFSRTFVFSFLLLASRQICEIGLNISARVIELLQVVDTVHLPRPDETHFNTGAAWLLVLIIGLVIMWQVLKLFVSIGERYVVVATLTFLSPLAFAMGGSKNTAEIFKGWVRMFASMCVMMVSNIIFLKMLMSALRYMPEGLDSIPWAILIVGIARVAKKFDDLITRIGLNPAVTGNGLGRSFPGMVAYSVMRNMGHSVSKAAGASTGKAQRNSAGAPPHGGGPNSGKGAAAGGGKTSGGGAGRREAPAPPNGAYTPPGNNTTQQNGSAEASGRNHPNAPGGAPETQPNSYGIKPESSVFAATKSGQSVSDSNMGGATGSDATARPTNHGNEGKQSAPSGSAPNKSGTDGNAAAGRSTPVQTGRRTSAKPGTPNSHTRQGILRNKTVHGGGVSGEQGSAGQKTPPPTPPNRGTQNGVAHAAQGGQMKAPTGQGKAGANIRQGNVQSGQLHTPNEITGNGRQESSAPQRPPIGRKQPDSSGAAGKGDQSSATSARFTAVTGHHEQTAPHAAESIGGQEYSRHNPQTTNRQQSAASAGRSGTDTAPRPFRPPIGGKQPVHRAETNATPHQGNGRNSGNGNIAAPTASAIPQKGGQTQVRAAHQPNPPKTTAPSGVPGTAPQSQDTSSRPSRPPIGGKQSSHHAGTAAPPVQGGGRNGGSGNAPGSATSSITQKSGQAPSRATHQPNPQKTTAPTGTAGTVPQSQDTSSRPSRPPIGRKQVAPITGTAAPPIQGGGRNGGSGNVAAPTASVSPQKGEQTTSRPTHQPNLQKTIAPTGAAGTALRGKDTSNQPSRPPIGFGAPPKTGTPVEQSAVAAGGGRNRTVGQPAGSVPSTGAPKGGQEKPSRPAASERASDPPSPKGGRNQPSGNTPAPVISVQAAQGGQERPSRPPIASGEPQPRSVGGGRNAPAPYTPAPVSNSNAPKGGQEKARRVSPASAQTQSTPKGVPGNSVTANAPKGGLRPEIRAAQHGVGQKKAFRFQTKEKK